MSTVTGKVLWATDALGSEINQETGQRFGCERLDGELVSCSEHHLINVMTGKVTLTGQTTEASVPGGFIASSYVNKVSSTSLVDKESGLPIWTFQSNAYFVDLLADGNILAAIQSGPRVDQVMKLDIANGKVLEQIDGEALPVGDSWLKVVQPDVIAHTLGTTERVDSSGSSMWKADGYALSDNWRLSQGIVTFGSLTPAPVIVSEATDQGQTVDAEIFQALDWATGSKLWSCSERTCGGARFFGFTPDRLVTSSMLLDRNTGASIAEFGGAYGGPRLIAADYLVVRDDNLKLTEVLSWEDGQRLWSTPADGSTFEAGSCFVIVDELNQTRVCPQ